MKKIIFIIFFLTLYNLAFGQFAETVRSIRPGNTMGVFTVGKKVFQVQQLFSFSREEYTNTRILETRIGNLVRYGITEKFEVQAIGNLGWNRTQSLDGTLEPSTISGLTGLILGARYHLGKPFGNELFYSAIQVRVNLPHSSDISEIDYLRSTIGIAAGQKIAEKVNFNIFLGYQINSDDTVDNRLNLGVRGAFRLNPKVALMLEHFGTFNNGIYVDGFDAGVDYLISDNVKLDVAAGWRNLPIVRANFGVVGITYRFHKKVIFSGREF